MGETPPGFRSGQLVLMRMTSLFDSMLSLKPHPEIVVKVLLRLHMRRTCSTVVL